MKIGNSVTSMKDNTLEMASLSLVQLAVNSNLNSPCPVKRRMYLILSNLVL